MLGYVNCPKSEDETKTEKEEALWNMAWNAQSHCHPSPEGHHGWDWHDEAREVYCVYCGDILTSDPE